MNSTWPYLNEVPSPIPARPFLQTTAPLEEGLPASPEALKFVQDEYRVEAKDCEIEIWYQGPDHNGLVPLKELALFLPDVIQVRDVPVFYEQETDLTLADEPEDESEIGILYEGYHTHSLIFEHPLTRKLQRELRVLAALSFSEPLVLMVRITYKCGKVPVLVSHFLANYVRCDDLLVKEGVLTARTVLQCFLGETLVPVQSGSVLSPSDLFEHLMLQAAVYQTSLDEGEFSFDEADGEELDEDEDAHDE